MKKLVKSLLPPILWHTYKVIKRKVSGVDANRLFWTGNYSSWQEAVRDSTGYDDKSIMEKCKNALLKVKNGEAVHERDSVLFDEIEYSWPLLAALEHVAIVNNNSLSVLDFGGSFGSTYYQNRYFLSPLKNVNWHIVEQAGFVEEGKKFFADDKLKFFHSIEESVSAKSPDVIILSGVLGYVENPYALLEKILSVQIPYIIIDRTAVVSHSKDIIAIQNTPATIYKAKYPTRFFGWENFKQQFRGYELVSSFDMEEGRSIPLENGIKGNYKGLFLRLKK